MLYILIFCLKSNKYFALDTCCFKKNIATKFSKSYSALFGSTNVNHYFQRWNIGFTKSQCYNYIITFTGVTLFLYILELPTKCTYLIFLAKKDMQFYWRLNWDIWSAWFWYFKSMFYTLQRTNSESKYDNRKRNLKRSPNGRNPYRWVKWISSRNSIKDCGTL
mgnify:CR=1 FL=1